MQPDVSLWPAVSAKSHKSLQIKAGRLLCIQSVHHRPRSARTIGPQAFSCHKTVLRGGPAPVQLAQSHTLRQSYEPTIHGLAGCVCCRAIAIPPAKKEGGEHETRVTRIIIWVVARPTRTLYGKPSALGGNFRPRDRVSEDTGRWDESKKKKGDCAGR